jgi:hypothetical protein
MYLLQDVPITIFDDFSAEYIALTKLVASHVDLEYGTARQGVKMVLHETVFSENYWYFWAIRNYHISL